RARPAALPPGAEARAFRLSRQPCRTPSVRGTLQRPRARCCDRSTATRGGGSSDRRTRRRQVRPCLGALRALQVRLEDLAAAAQEVGMWSIESRHCLGDRVTHRIAWPAVAALAQELVEH